MCETNKKKLEHMLDTAFSSREPLILKEMPVKFEKQRLVMEVIADAFTKHTEMTEMELNKKLKAIYSDYASLRSMLIDFHLFERTEDGRCYWRVAYED